MSSNQNMVNDKQTLVEALSSFIEKYFEGTNEEVSEEPNVPTQQVTKAVDEEQRKALFIVLEPCGEDNPDLHGDVYTAEEVEKAADNFNTYCGQANVQHLIQTEHAQILESYITPVEFTLDTGKVIQKGTWLQTWKFPETEEGEVLWKGVKQGDFTGLSIGCTAATEEIEE